VVVIVWWLSKLGPVAVILSVPFVVDGVVAYLYPISPAGVEFKLTVEDWLAILIWRVTVEFGSKPPPETITGTVR
jgi:hypothetical protein